MGKKEKKKYKIKNKKIMGTLIVITILIITILSFLGYHYSKSQTLKIIKKNYNTYVLTNKNTNLYDKNKNKIGTIAKNYYLELEDIKNLTINQKYLKIKNTPYSIYYKDIKKTKKQEQQIETNSYYTELNKTLDTKKKIKLIKDNKEVLTLFKGLKTSIHSIDDNYYYINFLNTILKVKKTKDIKEIKEENKEDTSYVSVIYYETINDNCNDVNCLSPISVKAHIKKLQENKYYFINKEDYKKYIKGYINLKENAILLTTSKQNEFTKQIQEETKVPIETITEEDKIKIETTNKKTMRKDGIEHLNQYQAKKYTIIDEYLKMAKGEDIIDDGGENNAQEIPVVNYHFFFDSSQGESCNESICLETNKFEEQLKWIQENNYKTLTINEFADWKDGIIELPKHSVLLTIDDGAMGTGAHNGNKLIPLLEKYQQHATLFLITGWWDLSNYQSPFLDVQSHTDNLHFEAQCADGRGKVACSDYQTVKADLEQSLRILGGDNTSFCFPFYSYDKESLQALQDLNFRIAFIGGNVRAKRSSNNLLITRYPILNDITLNQFINMIK